MFRKESNQKVICVETLICDDVHRLLDGKTTLCQSETIELPDNDVDSDDGLPRLNPSYVSKDLVDEKTTTSVNNHIACYECENNHESEDFPELSDDENFIHIVIDEYMVPCVPCRITVPFSTLYQHWSANHPEDIVLNFVPMTGYDFKPYIKAHNECFLLKVIQNDAGYVFLVFHLAVKVRNKKSVKYSYRMKLGPYNLSKANVLTAEINVSDLPIDVKEVNWTMFSYENFKLILQEDNRFTYLIEIFKD